MKAAAGVLMLMTMACTPVPPAASANEDLPVHGRSGKKCNAEPAQSLVGREADAALGAEVLRLTGAGALRWIRPGMMVTMDYREDRVNIHLDPANRVTRIACG